MQKIFALVDCNNFYASCERVFNPALVGRPVVVLSNNDGCIIARSNEAKALGIGMGAPYYRHKARLARHGVRVFSSNYALYGDLSSRVMAVLQGLEPEVEIYSIDEAFLALPAGNAFDLAAYGRQVQATVRQYTGIPVSIGMAATRTLAKIANLLAKQDGSHHGVLDLSRSGDLDGVLATVAVEDVWGIGSRSAAKLKARGIRTALDLQGCDDGLLRRLLSVTGLRTAMELRGIPCISLENAPRARKSIVHSRTFAGPVQALPELREAVAGYVTRAAERLRQGRLMAGCLDIFIETSRFRTDRPQYNGHRTVVLPTPTAQTPALIQCALKGLAGIYRPGFSYKRAGVIFTGLISGDHVQQHLFHTADSGNTPLMGAVDSINRRWGGNTVHWAAAGFTRYRGLKQSGKSPAYTTDWQELPVVRA